MRENAVFDADAAVPFPSMASWTLSRQIQPPIGRPVLRVLHKITSSQADPGLDRRGDTDHLAPPTDLPDRALRHVRRGDLLGVDFRETVEPERIPEALFEILDRVGEVILVF